MLVVGGVPVAGSGAATGLHSHMWTPEGRAAGSARAATSAGRCRLGSKCRGRAHATRFVYARQRLSRGVDSFTCSGPFVTLLRHRSGLGAGSAGLLPLR